MLPVTEAVANIPWLPRREAVARAARHRGCAPEDAELQIVGKVKAGQIKCVTSEGYAVSLLPAVSGGMIARDAGSLSCEIANVELCFIDLVAADLLPAPAERARWSAAEAITYLVKGVPLPWKEWQRAGATAPEIERAEIDLAQAVSEGVPAWGWHPLKKRRKRIPSDHFRDEMIENKTLPVSVARPPKVVVDCAGCVTTAPRQRFADYRGPHWQAIEVDAAALRRARPSPSTTQTEPAIADSAPAMAPKAWLSEPTIADLAPAIAPKAWLSEARREHPRQQNELRMPYASRLHALMQKANVTKVWPFKTLLRRLHDK